MTAQRSVLFTLRVLLITRDATRYLQHKVHSPKSLPHAGTCGKALQVQTLSRAKRHSIPLQDSHHSARIYTQTQALGGSHFSVLHVVIVGGSHFSVLQVVIVSCKPIIYTVCVRFYGISLPRDQCGSLRTFNGCILLSLECTHTCVDPSCAQNLFTMDTEG